MFNETRSLLWVPLLTVIFGSTLVAAETRLPEELVSELAEVRAHSSICQFKEFLPTHPTSELRHVIDQIIETGIADTDFYKTSLSQMEKELLLKEEEALKSSCHYLGTHIIRLVTEYQEAYCEIVAKGSCGAFTQPNT